MKPWTTVDITAILICRGAEATLPAALNSVTAQRPGQIIVAWTPTGEDDPTPGLVRRLAPEARILKVEAPGIAAARNAGVQAAMAAGMPLVAWCDADDRWMAGKLEAQLEALRTGGRWVITGLAKPDSDPLPGFTPSTCLMPIEFLQSVGEWDTRFHLAADHDWMVRARRLVEPVVLQDMFVHKGIHADNASHDRQAYRRELMRWARLQSGSSLASNAASPTDKP